MVKQSDEESDSMWAWQRRTGSFKPPAANEGGRMKTVSKLLLSLCLLMGFGAAMVAHAQIDSDATIEANIPYAFVVKDTQLPAGKYTIRVADETNPNMLEIRSAKGHTAVFFETENKLVNRTMRKSELVFDKIGDKYFLSQVFLKGDNSGNQLPESKMARRLEDGGHKAERHSVIAYLKRLK
jgi:hypothetical protein